MDAPLGIERPNVDRALADRYRTSPESDGGEACEAAAGRFEPVYLDNASRVRLREVVVSMPLRLRAGAQPLRLDLTVRNAFPCSRFGNLDSTARSVAPATSGLYTASAAVAIMRSVSLALVYGIQGMTAGSVAMPSAETFDRIRASRDNTESPGHARAAMTALAMCTASRARTGSFGKLDEAAART